MNSTDLTVDGMTCEHCVASVTEELTALEQVKEVKVALVPGGQSTVTIAHDGDLDKAKATAAVQEAGYTASW